MSGVNVSVCAICSSVTSGLDLLSYFVCLFGNLNLFGLLDVLGWLSSDCTCLLGFIDISCFFALPYLADLLVLNYRPCRRDSFFTYSAVLKMEILIAVRAQSPQKQTSIVEEESVSSVVSRLKV